MNARSLLIVLLLACLGLGAWYVLGGETAPAPVAPDKAGAAASQAANAELAKGAVQTGEVGERQPGTAGGPERSLAKQAANGPADVAGLRLRGRIVDAASAPRDGIEVQLSVWSTGEFVEEVGMPRERSPRPKPTVRTGRDGRFELPIARNSNGTLDVLGDEFVFDQRSPFFEVKNQDVDLGDLPVVAACSVQGVVQDDQGRPVPGVKIAVTFGALMLGESSQGVSGEDGAFTVGKLRPGQWTLRSASGNYLPHSEELELAANERRTGLVITLAKGRAIAGQVVDDRGVGVAGFRVGSKRSEARGAVAIERFTSDEAVRTDASGYFTLAGLADDHVMVRAFGPGHTQAVAAEVAVGTSNLVLRVDRLATVAGVLVDPDGKPIAGSRVWAAAAGSQGNGRIEIGGDVEMPMPMPMGNNATATAADGTFRLESVRPGLVAIHAEGKQHIAAEIDGIQATPGVVVEGVRIVASRGAAVRVTVRDGDGAPVADADVSIRDAIQGTGRSDLGPAGFEVAEMTMGSSGPGLGLGSAKTDTHGVATIAGLAAGEVEVTAKSAALAPARPVRVTVPTNGTAEVELVLTQPGYADVIVRDVDGKVVGDADVLVASDGDQGLPPARGRTDERGVAHIGPLAAGTYEASLVRGDSRAGRVGNVSFAFGNEAKSVDGSARQFAVIAGKTTQVELQRPLLARVHGIVTGADGPMAGVQVALQGDGEPGFAMPGFHGEHEITTGADGRFAFDGIESGRYTLRYGKPGQVVAATQDLEVPPQTADVQKDLTVAVGKLRVQIVAKDGGTPIAGAEVDVRRAASTTEGAPEHREQRMMMVSMRMASGDDDEDGAETTTMTVGAQTATTDGEGWAVIDDVPVGTYDLAVSHKQFADNSVKGRVVVAQQTTECGRCELGAAGRLRGRVLKADGSLTMALVTTKPVAGGEWSAPPEVAMGGNFRVKGLAAGKYLVRAQLMGTGEQYGPEVEVEVRGGETTDVDLRLP